MALIRRDDYKKWLDEFREKKLVKVLTGLRRSGRQRQATLRRLHRIWWTARFA